MAFLKGLTAEEMEVRVMTPEEAPKQGVKVWERDFAKYLQSDIRLESLYQED